MLTVTGIGSGLDIEGLVQDLMKVEGATLKSLENKEKQYKAELSAYGKLKSAMDNFENATNQLNDENSFYDYTVNTSLDQNVSVTINDFADVGSYVVNVNQLAAAHKISSGPYTDNNAVLALQGQLQITSGDNTFVIDVDTADSLNDIKDSINNISANTSVKASIINTSNNGNNEYRLILTSINTGVDNAISLQDVTGTLKSSLNLTNTVTAATDASFTFDGFALTSSSNTISTIADGLTITLQSISLSPTIITVEKEVDDANQKINNFVDAYNDLLAAFKTQKEAGLKQDRSSLMRIDQSFRTIAQGASYNSGSLSYLQEIGVTTDTYTGKLIVDQVFLNQQLTSNIDSVVALFTDKTTGFAAQFQLVIDSFSEDGGTYSIKENSIENKIDSIEDKIEREKIHLQKIEEGYKKQFNSLDILLASLTQTSDYLTEQLSNLPMLGGNKKK